MDREAQRFEAGSTSAVAPGALTWRCLRFLGAVVAELAVLSVMVALGRAGPFARCSARHFESFTDPGRVQPAAIGYLHDVLVAYEVVWMLGHRHQGGLGRSRPAFDARKVG